MLNVIMCLVGALAVAASAQERGATILSDEFDTAATFAERWVPQGRTIKPEAGRIAFPGGGSLTMRGSTPLEFYAEMDITADMSHQPDHSKWSHAFCGFRIEGFSFLILPSGNTWMIYKLTGYEKAHGKQVKIDDFEHKKPVRLTLIRKVDNATATYSYRVNGKDAGSFVCEAPAALSDGGGAPGAGKPLEIFSYNVNMTLEAFSISALRRSSDDSRNVVINSSFEHEQEGFPLYYCRSGFDLAKAALIPYEQFLATWTLDTAEKHSGNQSLKMVFDESMGGQNLWAWGAGTVKDLPGVFSVWLKADREDFPVSIGYGKRKEVKVGTSWKRYEVANPKLPGAGVYSPVTISFNKVRGTLWADDLQAELLSVPDGAALTNEGVYATPYKPSELDKQRFGKSEAVPVRAPEITLAKLPEGLVPAGDLDAWKGKAAKLDTFFFKLEKARNRTEAYLACDDRTLYIGYRCFVADLSAVNTTRDAHDSFSVFGKDSVEFFLDPCADGLFYHFAVDAGGTRLDMGRGRDVAWNGTWDAKVKLNEALKSIDYEIAIPFASLAASAMKSRWLVNVCRNDSTVKEQIAVTRTPTLGFKRTEYWPYAQFPAEIVARYSVGVSSGAYADDGGGTAVSLVIGNLTGKELHVRAELLDEQNRAGALAEKDELLKRGQTHVAFIAKTKTNRIRLKLSANGEPLTDQVVPLEKRNVVSMLGRLSYYMNEKEAVFKVQTTVAHADQMIAALTVAGKTVTMPAAPEFKIAVPLKDLPEGTNSVALVLSKDNQKVAETASTLVKRPYRAGAAQVNHFTRSLMHDGKPVFQFAPFFVFSKHQPEAYVRGAVDFCDGYGFKYLHILVDNRAPDQAVWALEHAQQKGMRVMLWTKYNERTDEEVAALRRRLDFPNVISQMVMDEPELGMPSDDARAFLRKMRALYPYHPVHMNNTVLGIPNRYANLETDLLMLDDYLTNVEKRTVPSVVNQTDIMWEAGKEEGKPCFYFLVGGNFPLHHREPSYDEQVAQTYGSIAAGCTGLSFFYGVPATPGNWKAYVQLNREVLSLNDVLLSEEDVLPATSSADAKTVRAITRKHAGFVYVVTCNISDKAIDPVTFTLSAQSAYAGEAEVLFESRKVPAGGGTFTDSFAPHARHVYKVRLK